MKKKSKLISKKRIINNEAIYHNQRLIILLLLFALGVFIGARLNKTAGTDISEQIKSMTESLISIRSSQSALNRFISFLFPDAVLILLSLFLGLSLTGDAGIILIPLFKGFSVGALCGSLVKCYELKGFFYIVVLLALPTALSVAALITSCKENMLTSKEIRQIINGEAKQALNIKMLIIRVIILFLTVCLSAGLYALLSALFTARLNPLS